jgi:hypothetical protein
MELEGLHHVTAVTANASGNVARAGMAPDYPNAPAHTIDERG